MGRYTEGGVGRDMLVGAVAGVAAIWVADKLDRALFRAGGAESMRRTQAARPGGMDPAHVLAKRAADKVGVDVGDPADNAAGRAVHYGIAAGMGALYGLLRGLTPAVTTGRGALFGVAMFVLQDEIGNTAMGTAGNPLRYPLRDHGRGAATHVLFGIVTDLGTRLLSPWRDRVVIEQGPPIRERLESGRAYLGQTRDQAVRQGWEYARQGAGYGTRLVEQARARLPDRDAVAEVAQAGRKRAGRVADDARSRLAELDPAGMADAARRRAARVADEAPSFLSEAIAGVISGVTRRLSA